MLRHLSFTGSSEKTPARYKSASYNQALAMLPEELRTEILSHIREDIFQQALETKEPDTKAEGDVFERSVEKSDEPSPRTGEKRKLSTPETGEQAQSKEKKPVSDKEIAIFNLLHHFSPHTLEYARQNRDYLRRSLKAGDMPVFSALLEHGSNPDLPHLVNKAAGYGNQAALKKLLDKAEKTHSPISKETLNKSLRLAATEGHDAVVKTLLDTGVEPNAANNKGTTPLHLAAKNGHDAVVKTLLDKGAVPDTADNEWCTPLFLAAHRGHGSVVDILLKANADPDNSNILGDTPLHIAVGEAPREGHMDMVKSLLAHGASLKVANADGYTPLHYAVLENHEPIVKLLLDKGPDLQAVNDDGDTPLQLAEVNGHQAIAELLRRHGATE